jgi:hypothetical protein
MNYTYTKFGNEIPNFECMVVEGSSKKEDVYFHILYILKKTGRKKSSPIICF